MCSPVDDRSRSLSPSSKTATAMIKAAMEPDSMVTFPLITEICERLENKPDEMSDVARLLVKALEDDNTSVRTKLQALTITNELMYNPRAIDAFRAQPGTRAAIDALRQIKETDLGPITEDLVRTLAEQTGRWFPTCGGPGRGEGAESGWDKLLTTAAAKKNSMQEVLMRAVSNRQESASVAAATRLRDEARACFDRKDFAAAAEKRSKAVGLLRDSDGQMTSELGLVLLGEYGAALLMQGDHKGALSPLEEALRERRTTRSTYKRPTVASEAGAQLATNLGIARTGIGELPEAIASLSEAVYLRKSLGSYTTLAGSRLMRNVGWARLSADENEEAKEAYAEAGRILQQLGAPKSEDVARAAHGTASAMLRLGDRQGALTRLREAKDVLEELGLLHTTRLGAQVLAGIEQASWETQACGYSSYTVGDKASAGELFGIKMDTLRDTLLRFFGV